MAETVNLPAIGQVKKQYAFAGVALVVGIAGYAWWRAQSAGGEVAYGIDPATGSPAGGLSYANPVPDPEDPYDEPDAPPRTNQEWTSRTLIALAEQGIEPGFASQTIGRYLDRRPLTSAEADVVRQAWALMGKPPEGPTTFTLDPSGGNPGGPGNPNPSGVPAAPTGVRVLSPSPTQLTIGWNPVTGATGYQVAVTSRADYHDWTSNLGVAGGYTVRGLKPGLDVRIQVRARNGAGVGPWSAALQTRTPR